VTTDRNRTVAEHPEEPTDGGWGTQFPFSQPGDWVSLADISHGAKALYTVYCGHVNKKKNGNGVWPSQASLANILRATEKTVRKWNAELEHIKAIVVTEVIDPRNGHKRLYVEVNQAAPSGYDGYVDYETYYRDQREIRKNMKPTLIEVAAANDPRTPPVKSTGGPEEKSTGGNDQGKHEPPVKITEGQGSKSTAGLGEKVPVKKTNPRRPKEEDHTHPGEPEPNDTVESQAETSVCVDSETQTNLLKRLIYTAVVDRAPASKAVPSGEQLYYLLSLTQQCVNLGVDLDTIDAALNRRIDHKTEQPYGHARKELEALIGRTKDQSFKAATATQSAEHPPAWTDSLGNHWEPVGPLQRACEGRDCHDISGLKYVSIDEPTLGAFSCPTCKDTYGKQVPQA